MPPSYWVEALGVATYLHNILPTKTLGFATLHSALHRVPPTYDHLRVFGCACYPTSLPQPLTSLRRVLHSVFFLATLLTTRDTTALTVPPIELSSLVMCPLMRDRFPLLSRLVLAVRPTLSSWMILLLTCRPPLDRHLLFPLQDLPPASPHCHTRPPASPRCHTWSPALRRRHQQVPRLTPAEPGHLLASHPAWWGLQHWLSPTAGPLHRQPP